MLIKRYHFSRPSLCLWFIFNFDRLDMLASFWATYLRRGNETKTGILAFLAQPHSHASTESQSHLNRVSSPCLRVSSPCSTESHPHASESHPHASTESHPYASTESHPHASTMSHPHVQLSLIPMPLLSLIPMPPLSLIPMIKLETLYPFSPFVYIHNNSILVRS